MEKKDAEMMNLRILLGKSIEDIFSELRNRKADEKKTDVVLNESKFETKSERAKIR